MSEYTKADLEVAGAKISGRNPRLEQVGKVLGLPLKKGGPNDSTHAFEAGERRMAMAIVTESSRELLRLAQSRSGMTAEAAEAYVNATVTKAYEKAAQNSHYDSERYRSVSEAIGTAADAQKRKTPLVTEAQSKEYDRAALRFTPERVNICENQSTIGRNETPTSNDLILNALKGR